MTPSPATSPAPFNAITRVLESGFPASHVIPIAPPNGKMGDRMHPGSAGKVPARLEGDVWQPLADWREPVDPDWLAFCGEHGANAGLRLGRNPGGAFLALDFDFAPGCERLREIAVEAAAEFLTQPLALRSTAPHRALALFALPPGAEPGRKAVWKLANAEGEALGHLEILAEGQQCVVAGVHHSGAAIAWGEDSAPLADLVPVVPTRGVVLTLLDAVLARLAHTGITVSARTVSADTSGRNPGAAFLAPPSADAVVALLDSLPNPAPTPRETYLKVLLAAKGCLDGLAAVGALTDADAERIADAAVRWAVRWPSTPGEDVEREKWDSDISTRDEPLAGWHSLQQVAGMLRPSYRLEVAQEEFAAYPSTPAAPEDPEAWRNRLMVNDKGNAQATLANAAAALRAAPEWRGVLSYNEFASTVLMAATPPWHGLATSRWEPREVTDTDVTAATVWLQENGIRVAEGVVASALAMVAKDHTFHPVREYLDGLKWDGTPRAETWLQRFMGVEDSALHRAFAARWLIGAVARVYRPGCKMDTVLVLEGPQGIGKSSAIATLANGWSTDHMPDLASKDAPIQLQGRWIVEMAEFDALGRAEVARAKAFISTETDRFRAPYARVAEDFPRQSVFAATINPGSRDYLSDESGARRFWPVRCGGGEVDRAALAAERDQLWAEAVVMFRAGAVWWLDTPDLKAAHHVATLERLEADPLTEPVRRIVGDARHATVAEIMDGLGLAPRDRTPAMQSRISKVLTVADWVPERRRGNGFQVRCYRAPGVPARATVIRLADVRNAAARVEAADLAALL